MKLPSSKKRYENIGRFSYPSGTPGDIPGLMDHHPYGVAESCPQPAPPRDDVAMRGPSFDKPSNRVHGFQTIARHGLGKAMRSTVKVKWVFVSALIALLAPYRAGALELGDIKLNSYLNQPLDAQISVLPAEVGELDEARIGVASQNDYEKAGIDRSTAPDLIKFTLVKDKDGKPVIKLTSQDAIKEPFIDFILEVTGPKGQVMREYTVLLDPPVTTQKAPSPTETPVAGVSGEKTIVGSAAPEQETATAAPTPAIATRSIEPKLGHDSYGPTMRSNTLWSIAKALRPNTSVSIQQVMLAMVKKNPEAFFNNNVNGLKAGYILRIPDEGLIKQVNEADAVQEVNLERQGWMQSRNDQTPPASAAQKFSPSGEQTKAKPEAAATSADAAQGDRGASQPTAGTTAAASTLPDNLVQADSR